MRKHAWLVVTAVFLLPLACGSSDEATEHRVTLEPEKTRALYAGLGGVWEANVPDGTGVGTSVGRLELCEDTRDLPSDSEEDRRYRMRSSDSSPRELTTTDGQGGGGGMGCSSYVPDRDVVAAWRGTWTTKDGTVDINVSYRAREVAYPERYALSYAVEEKQGIGPSGTGAFSLGGGLSLSSKLVKLPEGRPDLVFRRVGDAKCGAPPSADAGRDAESDVASPDADAGSSDAAADVVDATTE